MKEWMVQVVDSSAALPWDKLLFLLAVRLIASLIFGLLVVAVYKSTRRSATVTATFPATLVLLSVLIAMVTQVIGDNIARAFSLVGALSVVRFRTVVRDTKDTAFVIAAVAMGMAIGLGQGAVATCGMIVFTVAAYIFRDRPTAVVDILRDMQIEIRLVWSPELEAAVLKIIGRFAGEIEPISASTVRHGVGMDLAYKLRVPAHASLSEMISELSRIEGVQSAEVTKEKDES